VLSLRSALRTALAGFFVHCSLTSLLALAFLFTAHCSLLAHCSRWLSFFAHCSLLALAFFFCSPHCSRWLSFFAHCSLLTARALLTHCSLTSLLALAFFFCSLLTAHCSRTAHALLAHLTAHALAFFFCSLLTARSLRIARAWLAFLLQMTSELMENELMPSESSEPTVKAEQVNIEVRFCDQQPGSACDL